MAIPASIPIDDLERLEVILKLTRELGVNLAGVEIILNMREKMEAMQDQIEQFVATLNNEFATHVRRPPQEDQRSLIPVIHMAPLPRKDESKPRRGRAG